MVGVFGRIFRLSGVGIAGVCRMNRWRSQKMSEEHITFGLVDPNTFRGRVWDFPDPINPDHYKFNGIEVIQLTEQLNFCRGNAIKYLARAGAKDPTKEIEDLRKAAWYVQREIERLTGASSDQ